MRFAVFFRLAVEYYACCFAFHRRDVGFRHVRRYDRAMPERHFPPPWSVEELDSCFVVKDLNG
jgi:hypothetical protein